jgi:hypothetical protein
MNPMALAKTLFERLDQAVRIEPVSDPSWHGLPGKCHDNVEKWIALHPSDRAFRGFLITPIFSGALFDLHSIVQRQDGSLVDVTPLAYPCRFIRYELSVAQFEACRKHCNQLPYSTIDVR